MRTLCAKLNLANRPRLRRWSRGWPYLQDPSLPTKLRYLGSAIRQAFSDGMRIVLHNMPDQFGFRETGCLAQLSEMLQPHFLILLADR